MLLEPGADRVNDEIPDESLLFNGYTLFRCDRQNRPGGGVCVWIQDQFHPCQLHHQRHDFIESLTILLSKIDTIVWCL